MYERNSIVLQGTLVETPAFSHRVYGEGFYELRMEVPRLSGQVDLLPLTVSERMMEGVDLSPGREMGVSGQVRSYNKILKGVSRLIITVFVRDFLEPGGTAVNQVELTGTLCKPPVYRMTPLNREISDLLLAVNRLGNKSDYIPSIAWGRNARFAGGLKVGEHIHLEGRLQSRVYQKVLEDRVVERTAYEVSVSYLQLLEENEL
ncbi:single-stranded DNA-binding protein [Gehongia tenuis]|uniref:Single-stranded DNA-binding protein n=1 Tax=Gehongia tenuis TaxID=2763655 RepID=A0A926D3E7_9FIRM|nr:single-stranded DNA-binding protein [Gehongia tenuis]MBC8530754.1 single-stranded DNA-binding protein [Gehongia tenuis]